MFIFYDLKELILQGKTLKCEQLDEHKCCSVFIEQWQEKYLDVDISLLVEINYLSIKILWYVLLN